MEIISRAEFARRVGITRSGSTKLVKRSTIPSVNGNIDWDDPAVQAWVEVRRMSAPAQGPSRRGRPLAGANYTMEDTIRGRMRRSETADDGDLAGLDEGSKSRVLQNKLTAEKLKSKRIENMKELGALVPALAVRRAFSALVTVLEQQFRQLDSTASIEIDQMVESYKGEQSKADVGAVIRREVDLAAKSFVDAGRRAIREMRAEAAASIEQETEAAPE